ncbi:polyprenol monophosphomannose synthase [Candidatus Bathyarchaeota archaeon]|nr:polyprenol monophosphomannose synthase [Candidatus Bathyarchaeota archaeon]
MKASRTDGASVSDVAVILPTYCEADNIGNLIHTIMNLGIDPKVLVIDDSSPDGTGEIVKKMQEVCPNIVLLSRPFKAGLGTAITCGFRFLLSEQVPPKYIITMDADHSHNPEDLPRLLQAAKNGYDVVVGSRYCDGGRVEGWGIGRLAMSKVANKITAAIVSLPINDFTSGFRCYSKEYVERVLPNLHCHTYEIQIETLRQAHIHNAHVTEIPIAFANRKKGKSKLTANEILSFFLYALKAALRNRSTPEFK